MRELAQKLGALDQDVSEALKVVTYFDTLLTRGAGIDAFVRGAAVLAGVPARFVHPLHQLAIEVDPSGHISHGPFTPPLASWPSSEVGDGSGGAVWLERPNGPQLLDAMMLERLAVGIRLTLDRISPSTLDETAAVELLLTPGATTDARRKALKRLNLTPDTTVRVIVADGDASPLPGMHHAEIDSPYGRVTAHVATAAGVEPGGRIGIGSETRATHIEKSWEQAFMAWRVTTRLHPRLTWQETALLAPLVKAIDNGYTSHDLDIVRGLAADPTQLDTLEALGTSDSTRQAATMLGLHHSTVQARQAHVESLLGYSVGDTFGRMRIALAVFAVRANRGAAADTR
ncbi:helix-turn-helix domain-containing protein [Microbacterium sp.]|uniref:helix-turn-helix domain-containing protein n=1 Tax=Microbacterium sp. TaxID=51671 RepID=UPI0039E52440